ncbi:Aminoglycoside phosphotransferase [Neofusicoccum parvum]|uniref:Aminoglycoside phosphotransferase n=1 Tax=Neofusicoccum parvum TaxID=310453 RepID=A0ACB5RQU4_9PEZI|nr:Aminoglycoside phosphotransferase [Neofusicoccum parvum]
MVTQSEPNLTIPPTAISTNGYLTPVTEIPTPSSGPSPSTTPAPKNLHLPPTPTNEMPPPSPYEADPSRIPATDEFRDMPHYGRYRPSPSDFVPERRHVLSTTAASIAYWEDFLQKNCTADTLMLSPVDDDPSVALGRWIFAVGGAVVKTNHLAPAGRRRRDYAGVDRNEVEAVRLVRERVVGSDVRVPEVYFAGKLLDGDVLIQQRLPGVSLEVAWPYLSPAQKTSFKAQARAFLTALLAVGPSPSGKRQYVVDDYNAIWARALTPRERRLLLPPAPAPAQQGRVGVGWAKRKDSAVSASSLSSAARFGRSGSGGGGGVFDDSSSGDDELNADPETDADTRFTHNDMSTGNIIVDGDRIVGVVDWEHAGFLGWRTATLIHREIRAPLEEMYERGEWSEEEWADLFAWKDLYEVEVPGV